MNSSHARPRILVIGPVPPTTPSATNPIGGTAIHFIETIREFRARSLPLCIVDTTRPRANLGRFFFFLHAGIKVISIALQSLRAGKYCDIVFLNVTAGRTWALGVLFSLICAFRRRPMILRVFGGELNEVLDAYSRPKRWLADHTFMRCARIYVQTHAIQRTLSDRSNVRWLPNTRDVRIGASSAPSTAKRFLFIAQLRREKGIYETLEACRDLPDGCHLSIYGPQVEAMDGDLLETHSCASYRGLLAHQDVPAVIARHDVLLLPTYFRSEGYPGVIIEAFQCGRPVIATTWKSIPEVVEHDCNGILVPPRSSAELRAAIRRVIEDPDLYRRLCAGARTRGEFFRSSRWYDRLEDEVHAIHHKRHEH